MHFHFILGRETSALSIFSTTAEENQTLRLAPSPKREEPRTEDESMEVDEVEHDTLLEAGQGDESMEVDVVDVLDEDKIHLSLTEPSSDLPSSLLPLSIVTTKEENGTIIVEKLDTPAIRKERAQRRKKEKRLAEAAAQKTQMLSHSTASLSMELSDAASPVAGPSRLPDEVPSEDVDVEIEADSELSELSEAGSQSPRSSRVPRPKPPGRTRVQPVRAKRGRAGAVCEPGAIVLPEDTMLEGGTLGMSCNLMYRCWFLLCRVSVWAKAREHLNTSFMTIPVLKFRL